ncbi:MAG: hypothetical protein GOV15_03955, partial [Candidatus Diapherotrites archaeon]|nr:hypothetical protein [Candidatus Diapherotrites archaeon]
MNNTQKEVHYWNLPLGLRLGLGNKEILTVRKILQKYGKSKEIEAQIKYAYGSHIKGTRLNVKLPINLNNEAYAKIYSLMASEGSHRT